MTMLSKNTCKKCSGDMYLNADKDLSCFTCGATVVLTVRRASDIKGIRKPVEKLIEKWRMENNGVQRRKGRPRKFL